MNLIAYANGQNDIFKISNLLNLSLNETCKELRILKSKNILI